MARTESTMIPLGTPAFPFTLPEPLTGKLRSLAELKSPKATVIMFICNHCPYVIHIRPTLLQVAQKYIAKGVSFIAINSNDVANFPDDSPEKMAEDAKNHHYPFVYLFDETQEVAKAYHAACTPDFYIFDQNLNCRYRGQFDESRPSSPVSPDGGDLTAALEQLLAGKEVDSDQSPSLGCNIKWKS